MNSTSDRDLPALNKYEPLLLKAKPSSHLTFDTMVHSKANAFPLELAKSIANAHSSSAYSPFFIYSDVGLGKTHLLTAITNASTALSACLVNAVDLEMELERAIRLDSRAELIRWLTDFDILLIDDIQCALGHGVFEQALFAIVNMMSATSRILVVTSDTAPTNLTGVAPGIVSRLRGGVIASLVMPGPVARTKIIRSICPDDNLSDEVVGYLADNVKDSVRHLKAAVRQLLSMKEHSHMEVNVDIARVVVPLPEDLRHTSTAPSPSVYDFKSVPPESGKEQYKQMIATAKNEEEQNLALQIAIGGRLREIRENGVNNEMQSQLETALRLLRDGKIEEAIAFVR